MILIVSNNQDEGFNIQARLIETLGINCICVGNFKDEYIQKHKFDVLIFNCGKYEIKRIEFIESVSKFYQGIHIICLSKEESDFFTDFPNIIVIPKNNYNLLVTTLKNIFTELFDEEYWIDKINEIQEYILADIKSINSVEDIIEKFAVPERKLSSEFKYRTGHCIKSFILNTKFNLIINVLQETKKLGNYYRIARECGIADDKALYNIVKRKTNKTPTEFHRELLNKKCPQ